MLHLCCLLQHTKLTQFLLDKYAATDCTEAVRRGEEKEKRTVKFVNTVYTGLLYCGECSLHLCCANDDKEMIKMLLDADADVATPFAHGEFFRGFLYYGGSVLGFAAINASVEVFQALVERGTLRACVLGVIVWLDGSGGKVDAIDHLGNSLLHLCVLHSKPDVFKIIMKKHADVMSRFLVAPNNKGYTPLLLAAYCRNRTMFELVEDATSTRVWKFGEVICCTHLLTDLDPLIAAIHGRKSLLEFSK